MLRGTAVGARFFTDQSGNVTGLINPAGGVMSLTAAQLVSAYEAQQRENSALGHFLEARAGLVSADTPTISESTTIPSSDATDPATQRIYLFGSDLSASTELTIAQAALGKTWLKGFSPGAFNFGYGGLYRTSSAMNAYNVNGNQSKRPSDNYGYDNNLTYADIVLDSDVLYFKMIAGNLFTLWVNDNLVSSTATAGLNITYTASTQNFLVGGSNGYVKIKFPSVARRTIRIAFSLVNGVGDLWTRAVSTITPRHNAPVEWVHFGDSFSQYNGATATVRSLSEYMNTAYGKNINFINVAMGSTSFAVTTQNFPGVAPVNSQKASFYENFYGNWINCSPKIITGLVGQNDANLATGVLTPRIVEMLKAVRTAFPSAIIAIFASNTCPASITAGYDIATESIILNAVSSLNLGIFTVPMQSTANPAGAWLRGTGYAGATTGVGNTDLYTTTDAVHPSDAGHKATGMWMADRLYEVLKSHMLN